MAEIAKLHIYCVRVIDSDKIICRGCHSEMRNVVSLALLHTDDNVIIKKLIDCITLVTSHTSADLSRVRLRFRTPAKIFERIIINISIFVPIYVPTMTRLL